jgi:hypothetical protein
MMSSAVLYRRHRFPAEIISSCGWLYFRLCLRCRDIEELMLLRGVFVAYEAIRQWCRKVGQTFANALRCFKSPAQMQRFLSVQGIISTHFRPGRHRLRAPADRQQMAPHFQTWRAVTGLAS